jgi:hypothetical protein
MYLLSLAKKREVGRSEFCFNILFLNLHFREVLFVIFLYLLTVSNMLDTVSTVIDDIIKSGSRKRQNFQDITFAF